MKYIGDQVPPDLCQSLHILCWQREISHLWHLFLSNTAQISFGGVSIPVNGQESKHITRMFDFSIHQQIWLVSLFISFIKDVDGCMYFAGVSIDRSQNIWHVWSIMGCLNVRYINRSGWLHFLYLLKYMDFGYNVSIHQRHVFVSFIKDVDGFNECIYSPTKCAFSKNTYMPGSSFIRRFALH